MTHQVGWGLDIEKAFEHFVYDDIRLFAFDERPVPVVAPDIDNFSEMQAEQGIPAFRKGIAEDQRLAGSFVIVSVADVRVTGCALV